MQSQRWIRSDRDDPTQRKHGPTIAVISKLVGIVEMKAPCVLFTWIEFSVDAYLASNLQWTDWGLTGEDPDGSRQNIEMFAIRRCCIVQLNNAPYCITCKLRYLRCQNLSARKSLNPKRLTDGTCVYLCGPRRFRFFVASFSVPREHMSKTSVFNVIDFGSFCQLK